MDRAYKICGGMFGAADMTDNGLQAPHFMSEPCLKLLNGRSAIKLAYEHLAPGKIWMPSFLCHTMLDALPSDSTIEFYPINTSLHVQDLEWIESVNENDLVLFIDYFGFNLNEDALKEVKKIGAFVLQDAAQALLSTFDRGYADFVMYSPRKTLGVPDGGILKSKCDISFDDGKLNEPPSQYVIAVYKAFFERGYYDRSGAGSWFSYYKEAEGLNPSGAYEMTDLAQALLDRGFDYERIALQRRTNYKKLLSGLSRVAIIKELPDDVVPLGCPIMVSGRDRLLSKLHEHQFYCPVHWPLKNVVPARYEGAHELADNALTVLCDQRLSASAIDKMVQIIEDHIDS